MYAAHLSSALAMERQRALSEEAAAAHAVRLARGVRRWRTASGPLSAVISNLFAALRLRAAPTEISNAEASALPGAAPYPAPLR